MRRHTMIVAAAALLLPAAAHAATAKVEVTRFHVLAAPAAAITGAAIAVEPAPAADGTQPANTLQFGVLAAAAAGEFGRAGFKPVAEGQSADYIARIALTGSSEVVQKRSAFSIGLGGGGGSFGRGGGGGVGGGVSFPLGGGTRTVTAALMTMQIRRVSDNITVWEGRATTVAPGADAMSAAPVLLQALIKGFPGPSGQSTTLKVKTN